MGIVADDITRVKESADLVALISEHVPLKRAGRRYSGCCPFHDEKTPSFSVNPEMGFYYCFGCQKKGDAITFVREFLHMDFVEAVEFLAKKSNITLHYDSSRESNKGESAKVYECLNEAALFFNTLLKESDMAKHARQYVRSRGFGKDVVEEFTVGYSPDSYDALSRHLKGKYTADQLVAAGLCYKNSRGSLTDVFRGRLMFPIRNAAGSVIGFGARSLDGTPPKYKNTSETKMYRKSHVLYNIDKAKSAAVTAGNFVVCEGYTDVIALTLAGVPQAVATCGTAATLDHVTIMSKYVKKIILSFDTDAAGQNATGRWLEFLGSTDADIFVAQYNSSKDPAELYLDSPESILPAIESAIPFLDFLLERVVATLTSDDTIEQRARVAQEVVDVICKSTNALVREGYVMKYASRVGFEPEWFFDQLSATPSDRQVREAPREVDIRDEALSETERRQRELLRLCIHEPYSVSRYIRGDVFTHPLYREIFDALIDHENIEDALHSLSDRAHDVMNRLMVEDVAEVEDISPYSLDVFSRVVESQMKEFLHQLVREGADNTGRVKKLLDVMATSLEKGDSYALTTAASELLDIRSEMKAQSA